MAQLFKINDIVSYDLLKFQMAIFQIHCYFLLIKCKNPLPCKGFSMAKDSHILSTNNNSVFAYVVSIYLTSCLNDDVKLKKF